MSALSSTARKRGRPPKPRPPHPALGDILRDCQPLTTDERTEIDELVAGLKSAEDLYVASYPAFGVSRDLKVNVALADDRAFGEERATVFHKEYADRCNAGRRWRTEGAASARQEARDRHARIIAAAQDQLNLVASRKKSLSHVARHVARKLESDAGLSTVRRVLATELRRRRGLRSIS